MESRKNFYENELNMDRINEALEYVAKNLTLKEILKMIREISYDMVCYYDEDSKGRIYNGEYNQHQIQQATEIQNQLRTICDLFGQSIVNKNEFNDDYLSKYTQGGALSYRINELELELKKSKEKIEKLNEILNEESHV